MLFAVQRLEELSMLTYASSPAYLVGSVPPNLMLGSIESLVLRWKSRANVGDLRVGISDSKNVGKPNIVSFPAVSLEEDGARREFRDAILVFLPLRLALRNPNPSSPSHASSEVEDI